MKYMKVKPIETTVDHSYQRELEQPRVESMAKDFKPDLVGTVVLSRRSDGSLVRVDGQHRFAAACAAGYGETPMMAQIYDGLSLREEAALYVELNSNRKGIGAVDKYKGRLKAHDPTVVAIKQILDRHGLRVARTPARGVVQAIQAIGVAYHRGTLDKILTTLVAWLDRAPEAFAGPIVSGLNHFFMTFPDADPLHLASRLDKYAAQRLLSMIRRESHGPSRADGARYVFSEIYNLRLGRAKRLTLPTANGEPSAQNGALPRSSSSKQQQLPIGQA